MVGKESCHFKRFRLTVVVLLVRNNFVAMAGLSSSKSSILR